jgi:hypothetical protein
LWGKPLALGLRAHICRGRAAGVGFRASRENAETRLAALSGGRSVLRRPGLRENPTPEADCDGMGTGTGLEFGEQMAHVRLHGLF